MSTFSEGYMASDNSYQNLLELFRQEELENEREAQEKQNSTNFDNLLKLSIANEQSLPIPLWPNGSFTRELSVQETERGLYKTQWIWKNNRTDPLNLITGVKKVYYMCQGVWCCNHEQCNWTLRPMIRSKDLEKQRGCIIFLNLIFNLVDICCEQCQSPLTYLPCSARQIVSISPKGCIYQHIGLRYFWRN
jgi:hypothetical protein